MTATPQQQYRERVGARIRIAREDRGWSQAELAKRLGLDESVIRAAESGERLMQTEDFRRLRDLVGLDRKFFTDVFLLDGRERFSWRVEPGTPDDAVQRLQARAERWVGLLRWLYDWDGRLNAVREGPALLMEQESGVERARSMAGQLGFQLGLGPIAAERLAEKVEGELGVPVLFVDADPDRDNPDAEGILSGTCHLRDLDVILVNRRRSRGERMFGLAHELFQVLTWDEQEPAPVRVAQPLPTEEGNRAPREAADHFAAALLLPRHSLGWVCAQERSRNAAQLSKAAALLRVEPKLLAWHLREMGLADVVCLTDFPAPALPPDEALPKPFSRDFLGLLREAMQDQVSARRVADAMAMDGQMLGLAELFLEYDLEPPHTYL